MGLRYKIKIIIVIIIIIIIIIIIKTIKYSLILISYGNHAFSIRTVHLLPT